MADAAVASLFLDLRARTAKLEKDLDAANAKIRRKMQTSGRTMSRDMSTAMAGLGKIAAFTGVTLGLNAIKKSIFDVIDSSFQLQNTADKLGLTTTTLQELRFAGEQFNITQQTIDMGLQRFSRRLAEAAQGGGELKGTLDQYNIAARDAEGRTRGTMEVMREYADVIKNAESDQERLRLAFKAFDSEGVSFVNILKDGAKGLAEYSIRAQMFGQVIEASQTRKLADLKTNIDEAKSSWKSFWAEATGIGFSALEGLNLAGDDAKLDKLAGRIKELRRSSSVAPEFVFDTTAFGANFGEDLNELEVKFDSLLASMVKKKVAAEEALAIDLSNAIINRDSFAEGSPQFEYLERQIKNLKAAQDELGESTTRLIDKYPEAVVYAQEYQLAQKGVSNVLALTAEESARLKSILTSTISPLERYQEQVKLLEKAIEAMPYRAEEFEEAMRRIKASYEESLDPKPINVFIDNWEDMTKALPRDLTAALLDGEQGIKGFLARVLRQLAAAQLEAAIVAPFLQALGIGGTRGKTGGSGGSFGSGGSGWWSSLSSAFAGGFADGGNPPVGRPYLVGENGPELRIDRSPGTIIPHHAIAGMLGQGGYAGGDTVTVNQTINFPTNLADVRAQIRQAVPAISQATEAAIADKNRRRGIA